MDTTIKKFITNTTRSQQFNYFINLPRNDKLKADTRNNMIDWRYIVNNFCQEENTQQTTSFEKSNFKSFKARLITNELPVIQYISHSNRLYQLLLCPTCHNQTEDQQHIWICLVRLPMIKKIEQDFIDDIIKIACDKDIKDTIIYTLTNQLK